MATGFLDSPVGWICVSAEMDKVVSIEFLDKPPSREATALYPSSPVVKKAIRELTAYFKGELTSFDLSLLPEGTEFQKKVWTELLRIPYGATISYAELANRLGDPKCIRAAASANGRNPIPIVIPCHRVIGADGKMVGFSSGIWRKKILLQLEMENTPKTGVLF